MMWFIWPLFSQELPTCLQDQWVQAISEDLEVLHRHLLKRVVKHLGPWMEEEGEDVAGAQEEAGEERRTIIKMITICFVKLMEWEEH